MDGKPPFGQITDLLSSALDRTEEIRKHAKGRRLFVFLDYDGTMTPIVEDPERAFLSEQMRDAVRELAKRCNVAVISGRDLDDVQRLVGIDEIYYAGNHGFAITGPKGLQMDFKQNMGPMPALDLAEQRLRNRLTEIPGALVERKRFSIAVHYRRVAEEKIGVVKGVVEQVLGGHPEMRKSSGKKVFELQPKIDWNKGKALLWLVRSLEFARRDVLPIYVGDDMTDEDAFRVLRGWGIGIIVKEGSRPTAAQYALEDPDEVEEFLRVLISALDATVG